MNQPAISVRHLSKCYKLGTIGRHTLVDEAAYLWHKIRGKDPREHFSKVGHSATEVRKVASEQEGNKEFWAIKDVSFDVHAGQVVGVIGRNGAGKSTLLKILTRITEPTSGEAFIRGRVASLLEVGTGFHPELTGRENVYMNGTILGMKKREIDAKFDEIVAFAELEKFIDTPVKRYSSGMYVRLAFAVAGHLEPEILLIDEVLAVGDVSFQEKCIGKMNAVAHEGRTVLFVSHNLGAVRALCPNSLLLSDGQVEIYDQTGVVLSQYLADTNASTGCEKLCSASSDKAAYFTRLAVQSMEGFCAEQLDVLKPFKVILEYVVGKPIENVEISFCLYNERQQMICYSSQSESGTVEHPRLYPPGRYSAAVELPGHLLTPGLYYLSFDIYIPRVEIIDSQPYALAFSIVETGSVAAANSGQELGCFFTNFHWTVGTV